MNPHTNHSRHNTRTSQYLQPQPFPTDPYNDTLYGPPATARPRVHSAVDPQHFPSAQSGSLIAFPEPQIYSATSYNSPSSLAPSNSLPYSLSSHDLRATNLHRGVSVNSVSSTASSYYYPDEDHSLEEIYYGDNYERVSNEFSRLSLDAEEAVRRFQSGELLESEQEWHKLVSEEVREALGKREVQRQSVIFEVIKSERDYVADIRSVQDIFIKELRNASQSIIHPSKTASFIVDVFGNFDEILRHHERMLTALLRRQREQHPLIQSVGDIVLDTVLKAEYRSSYDVYIKHYPLSESLHRKELRNNPTYKAFLESVADDPRVRKRDLITFLSRPVTRLPRLSLLLEQIVKLTDKEYDHPDLEILPTILNIMSDFLKSTQPGIEAAESKVKLWELCEHLEYQKGEMIDMDLNDDSRTVVYSGPVVRRNRGETGFSSWTDLTASLLDNYFVLTRTVKRPGGIVKQQLMSRPIPLSYLRCASFDAPSESRREKSEEGGILDSLRYQTIDIFPFTIYHASDVLRRRYTLFVASNTLRRRWRSALEEALGVYKVRHEANMWYYPRSLTDGFFRSSGAKSVGKANTATPFTSGGRKYIAVGCRSGIFVSTWGKEEFTQVLGLSNPVQLAAVHELGEKQFHRLVVHYEHSILSYSLDIIARVVTKQAKPSTLDASMERIAGQDSNVLFFRLAEMGQRILIMYASKRLLQVTPSLHVLEAVDASNLVAKRGRKLRNFQPFGESGYVPKDATDISPLVKSVGVVTRDGIVIADPTNFAKSTVSLVPDLHSSNDATVTLLKNRLEGARPLGLIRVTPEELMVVYDTLGCYITKHGIPGRSGGFLKWETQAQSFAYRGCHLLLFSSDFIEIRDIRSGRLIQVIEGDEIRLLYFNASVGNNDPIIIGMKGRNDKEGVTDKLVELAETVELKPSSTIRSTISIPVTSTTAVLWDEWDL
ncbi:hypothetical protein AX15_004586 [Amanita polypyramis BW_CC]|nr:hypothetical protein AX15_004586 [Amanita polypyramis BW_CC]